MLNGNKSLIKRQIFAAYIRILMVWVPSQSALLVNSSSLITSLSPYYYYRYMQFLTMITENFLNYIKNYRDRN